MKNSNSVNPVLLSQEADRTVISYDFDTFDFNVGARLVKLKKTASDLYFVVASRSMRADLA